MSDGFVDLPPSETPVSEPDSVESPSSEEPRSEPELIAPTPAVVTQLTTRDFFATLGRRKPSSRSNGANGSGAAADTRAAAALAGAFGGSGAASSTATASESAPAPGKESEEDVARFRAWLDGLTGE